MPAGRPPLKFPEGWKESLLELGKKGKGPVHMAKAMGMAKSTFYEYIKKDQEFSDAFEAAMLECEIWWQNVGQEGLFMGGKDNPFQSSLYALQMSNRFGWNSSKNENKTDITSGGEKITEIQRVIVKPKD